MVLIIISRYENNTKRSITKKEKRQGKISRIGRKWYRTTLGKTHSNLPTPGSLVEEMIKDLSTLLLESEKETVPKVKIKVDAFRNLEIDNQDKYPLDDFLVDDMFRDDFLCLNLCLKKMKSRNLKELEDLAKVAPWMLLCKCNSQKCNEEIEE